MGNESTQPDPRVVYADIIDLPHWQSPTRPHMSLHDRAAQFAPFAALSGYDEMVTEEARLTDEQTILSETVLDVLDRKLRLLSEAIEEGQKPVCTITHFVQDALKAGGRYATVTEAVRKIDFFERKLILAKKAGRAGMYVTIDLDAILDMTGPLFEHSDI